MYVVCMYAAPGRLRELGQQCGLASARSLRTASDPMYVCARKGCDGNVSRHVKVTSTHTYIHIHTLHTSTTYNEIVPRNIFTHSDETVCVLEKHLFQRYHL